MKEDDYDEVVFRDSGDSLVQAVHKDQDYHDQTRQPDAPMSPRKS